jgi:hypothetical protein
MYEYVVAVCLKFHCNAPHVIRSRGEEFYNTPLKRLNFYKCVLKMTDSF